MPTSLHLVGFLPNLKLEAERTVAVGPLTLCSPMAEVMKKLSKTPGNRTGRRMLRRFRTTFREPFKPTCLLSSTPTIDEASARDFRNLAAITAIVHGTAVTLTGGQWLVRQTDHFSLFHFAPGRNGWIVTFHGVSQGVRELGSFQGTSLASIGDPGHFRCRFDEPLLRLLTWAWTTMHEKSRHTTRLRRLFRSLEVAFHAARFPSDGLTTANDIGTRIGLWVSAFEILLRPPTGNVDKVVVQRRLSTVDWWRRELIRRRYRVKQHGKWAMVGLPVKLYDRLYDARNAFMHGNPIVGRPLGWNRGDRVVPLDMVAACLFGAALRVAIAGIAPQPDTYDELVGLDLIAEALLPKS